LVVEPRTKVDGAGGALL